MDAPQQTTGSKPKQPLSSRWGGVTRALRHRNFRLFIGGQLLSLTGTWVQMVAQSWLVYRLSGSPVMLELVGFANQIPFLLLSPVAGVVADRVNRRRLITVTQILAMLQAFLLAGLTLAGAVEVWHIFCLALLLGVVSVFDMTARQSFLVEMVGKEELMNAIGLNSSVYNSGRILGPVVAGVLLAAIGEGYCFLLNGFTFLGVIIGLMMMRLPPPPPSEPHPSPFEHFQEGWNYIRHHAPSRALLLLLGVASIMNYPILILMPVFAVDILDVGAGGLGILLGAGSLGAIIASVWVGSTEDFRRRGLVLIGGAALAGLSLAAFGLATEFVGSYLLAIGLMFAVGTFSSLQGIANVTSLQLLVPDQMRGRVMGIHSISYTISTLGGMPIGAIANFIGAPFAVAIGGLAVTAFALGPALLNWRMRNLSALVRQAEETHALEP